MFVGQQISHVGHSLARTSPFIVSPQDFHQSRLAQCF